MRSIKSRVAAALATSLAVIGLSTSSAHGDRLIETVYGEPVTYVPTSYSYVSPVSYSYVPTSYSYTPTSYSYVPTSYATVLPASYATTASTYLPTSYTSVAPAYYETVSYRRPGLLRRLASRPVFETSRTYSYDTYPTTYYAPTTISYSAPAVQATGYVTACGESTTPFNPPAAVGGNETETSKSIISVPKDKPKDSVEPTYKEQPEEKAKVAPPKGTGGMEAAPDKEGGLAPSNELPQTSGKPEERNSFRPRFTDIKPKTTVTSQPMLRGEVVSGVTGQPREGLRVIFSDLKQRFPDREKLTDAKGTFEVFLPNGGWSVKVVDPKAAVGTAPKDYGQITATDGRYLDDADAPVYGLRLSN